MQAYIDATVWEITPENFFLEFVRGVAAILRRHGAAAELEQYAQPLAITATDPSTDNVQLYTCERLRARVLASGLGRLLRPCADPLTISECSGGHAGWQARLAALAARPLAFNEEPTVFGRSVSELREMAAAVSPFALRLGGALQDWDTMFRALVDYYGPSSEVRCGTELPDWKKVWRTVDAGTGDELWPWIDNAISLAGLLVMYLNGAPETEWPPERLMARPQMVDGVCVLSGMLVGITVSGEFGAEQSARLEDFPQFSQRLDVSVVRPPDSDCPE